MLSLNDFFDQSIADEFAQALPRLRAELGIRCISEFGGSFGVGANTFRALGGYTLPPSPVYRAWAAKQTKKLDGESICEKAGSRENFVNWHSSLIRGLQRDWTSAMGAPLSFAHSHKLVDLFLKWVAHFDFKTPDATDFLIEHANCALVFN